MASNNGNFIEELETKGAECYYGYIESLQDALLVGEAARQGKIKRVKNRLTEAERQQIRCGSVFVFAEGESGIKRWTDGKLWSPSRIFGSFFVYRELEQKMRSSRGKQLLKVPSVLLVAPEETEESIASFFGPEEPSEAELSQPVTETSRSKPAKCWQNESIEDESADDADSFDRNSILTPPPTDTEGSSLDFYPQKSSQPLGKSSQEMDFLLSGSFVDKMLIKKGGLIKKTISVQLSNSYFHIISYSRQLTRTASCSQFESPSRNPFFSQLQADLGKLSQVHPAFKRRRDDSGPDLRGISRMKLESGILVESQKRRRQPVSFTAPPISASNSLQDSPSGKMTSILQEALAAQAASFCFSDPKELAAATVLFLKFNCPVHALVDINRQFKEALDSSSFSHNII